MKSIDLKDRKILGEITENSRISYTQLSKKVHLSKNAVKYRIDRLKNKEIISQFTTIINLSALNLNTTTLLIRFNEDIYENKEVLNYFKNHRFANWLIVLSGQWDILVEFVIKDNNHLEEIINEMTKKFNNKINTYQTIFSMDIIKVKHTIPGIKPDLNYNKIKTEDRIKTKYKINETDKNILEILTKDSTLPYMTIAKKTNTTIDIVRNRIKNLIDKKIIIKFIADINLEKLDYTLYLQKIKLKNLSETKLKQLKKQIFYDKNITYAFFDPTSLNVLYISAFKKSNDIDQHTRSLRKSFSDIIEDQEYLLIKEELLFNLFPKGIHRL